MKHTISIPVVTMASQIFDHAKVCMTCEQPIPAGELVFMERDYPHVQFCSHPCHEKMEPGVVEYWDAAHRMFMVLAKRSQFAASGMSPSLQYFVASQSPRILDFEIKLERDKQLPAMLLEALRTRRESLSKFYNGCPDCLFIGHADEDYYLCGDLLVVKAAENHVTEIPVDNCNHPKWYTAERLDSVRVHPRGVSSLLQGREGRT